MIHTIGQNKVRHGDVMNSEGIAQLMRGEQADIFYSDPPRGKGTLKYWQTLNTKHNGVPSIDIDIDDFLSTIFNIAIKYSKNLVFIEYGRNWSKEIIGLAESKGLTHLGTGHPVYRSGANLLPMDLHVFAKHPIPIPQGYFESFEGVHGIDMIKIAVKPFATPGGILLDPCCGMGYCAKVALENGMIFRGNEINAKRLQKTIDFLKKSSV